MNEIKIKLDRGVRRIVATNRIGKERGTSNSNAEMEGKHWKGNIKVSNGVMEIRKGREEKCK